MRIQQLSVFPHPLTSVVASKAIAAGTQKNDDPQDVTSAGTVSKRGQSASTAVVTATVAATTIVASTSGSFRTAAAICSKTAKLHLCLKPPEII